MENSEPGSNYLINPSRPTASPTIPTRTDGSRTPTRAVPIPYHLGITPGAKKGRKKLPSYPEGVIMNSH